MSELVVFDLCDTLVAENTTVGFLRILAVRHSKVCVALRRWTTRRSAWFYAGALAQRLGKDIARERLMASLAGLSREEIDAASQLYATQAPLNAIVVNRLERHRMQCDNVQIISSSLDPIVGAVAVRLKVEGRGSTLGFQDGICTGRLEDDLTGSKLCIVRENDASLAAAYSDNRSDFELLAAAKHGVLVIPRFASRPTKLPAGVDEVLHA